MLKVTGKTKFVLNMFFKLILTMAIAGTSLLTFFLISYRPTYLVKLNGEEVGYISNKRAIQNEIDDYLQNGDRENVGYVVQRNEPTYEFALIKKDIEVSDEEVLAKAKAECEVYYRVYGINVNGTEELVVDNLKEAQELLEEINKEQKQYKKKSTVEISEKFVKEYTLADDVKLAVNNILDNIEEENNKVFGKNTTYTSVKKVSEEVLLALREKAKDLNFRKPLDTGILTSRYGIRSLGNHKGLDYGAPIGTPIHVAEEGIVTFAGVMGGYGNLVIVDHPSGYQTYYGHCSKLEAQVGDEVVRDQVIAYVGNTGRSTGPHVHFEIRVDGVTYNPEIFLAD